MQHASLSLAVALTAALICPTVSASPYRSALAATTVQPEGAPDAGPQPVAAEPVAAPAPEGPPPPSPSMTAPIPQPVKRRKGLMIAGWTMFGASYLFTALVAGIIHNTCDAVERPNCKRAAGLTLIPLVGPFFAIPQLNTDAITPKFFMALPGLVQIAGLAMGIAGTVQFVNDGKASRIADFDGFKLGARLRLNVAGTRFNDGGTLVLGGRF